MHSRMIISIRDFAEMMPPPLYPIITKSSQLPFWIYIIIHTREIYWPFTLAHVIQILYLCLVIEFHDVNMRSFQIHIIIFILIGFKCLYTIVSMEEELKCDFEWIMTPHRKATLTGSKVLISKIWDKEKLFEILNKNLRKIN